MTGAIPQSVEINTCHAKHPVAVRAFVSLSSQLTDDDNRVTGFVFFGGCCGAGMGTRFGAEDTTNAWQLRISEPGVFAPWLQPRIRTIRQQVADIPRLASQTQLSQLSHFGQPSLPAPFSPLVLRDDGLLWPLVESLSAIDIDWLGGNNAGYLVACSGVLIRLLLVFFLRSPMSPASP